jgi:hypothetical protein
MTPMSRKCRREGCAKWAIKGGTVCEKHGGANPAVRANAQIRHEVSRWTLGEAVDDPGETLLRLITQSRMRADLLSAEVERLLNTSAKSLTDTLTGESWGEGGKSGEYVRSIVEMESAERDRCANFCRLAIQAGLAERMVKVAERQAETAARALSAGLEAIGASVEQRRVALAAAGAYLRSA